jgi:hypothetical protein
MIVLTSMNTFANGETPAFKRDDRPGIFAGQGVGYKEV